VRKYSGASIGWHATEVLTRVWKTLAGFIQAQAAVSFVDALFIGLGLWALGVPLAFVLAVVTFFAGFIPIIGAVTAGALAVVIALVSNGLINALLVLALILLVTQIEGNVLQPILVYKVQGLLYAFVILYASCSACSARTYVSRHIAAANRAVQCNEPALIYRAAFSYCGFDPGWHHRCLLGSTCCRNHCHGVALPRRNDLAARQGNHA